MRKQGLIGARLRAAALAGALAALAGCSGPAPAAKTEAPPAAATAQPTALSISAATFGCIRDMTPVGRFYVGSLTGQLDAAVAVAQSKDGGVFPAGSIVQLVPGEVMVKREAGFNAQTKDWEFFELDVAPTGTTIRKRGHVDVVNRFGGNCLTCHEKAEAKFDMICSTDHGCDPIPLTDDMIRALQKTDPRCPTAVELTKAEKEALEFIRAATPPADDAAKATGSPS